MLDNFSCSAQKAIVLAETYAKEFGHTSVGTEHLLLALLKNEELFITKELELQGVKHKGFFDKTRRLYEKEKKLTHINYSLELKDVLQEAIKFGNKNKETVVSTDTLSLVLLTLKNTAKELLILNDVNVDLIIKKMLSLYKRKSELLSINDLHLLGSNNKDPLIGRDNEIVQLIYALSRRNKPNAILVGEPGVGKTAIIEELAKRMINGQVPLLKDKLIYELDLASTVSGTKYRGEFEDKLKKIIKKVKEDGKAILFIDEIHNVIKAGGAEGAIDASNILKPYLARGEIQIIGATTLEEFNDSFDKDKALKRRFQIIDVNESTKEETLNILEKVKPIYEDFYGIEIGDSCLSLIVELADKYLINQRFPDKAIELLDNSCVISNDKLEEEQIYTTMNKLYNVSINDQEKVDELEKELDKEIFGQEEVKEELIKLFSSGRTKALLFVGHNGCGKSRVAEIIAKTIYNNHFINLKIDNYIDINGINKLISNGFSYSGEQSSFLVKTLKEKPNSVILFEGMDKANNEIINFIQDMLEKGFFLDSKGNKINTSHALFIFSMNNQIEKYAQFNLSPVKSLADTNGKRKRIQDRFGYKFSSLLDEILFFEKINQNIYKNIVKKEIKKLNDEFVLELSDMTDIDEIELLNNGGDGALKKAKEIIKKNGKIKII